MNKRLERIENALSNFHYDECNSLWDSSCRSSGKGCDCTGPEDIEWLIGFAREWEY